MTKTAIVCDQCKQPIDPAKGRISFQPLRGGLTLVINNGTAEASKDITQAVDLCDAECLGDYIKAIGQQIKATPPAPVTPAAAS